MRFGILGPLVAESTAGPVRISGIRRSAVLGALLIRPGRTVRTSELIDAVWADHPPASAVDNLRTYVSELRNTFRRHDADGTILRATGGYRCVVTEHDLDLTAYQRLDDAGHQAQADGDLARAADLFSEAIALWRGAPLEGVPVGSWLRARTDGLAEARWSSMASQAEVRAGLGQYEQLVPELTELVAVRPLQEHLWELLMRCLYGCGRTAEALAAYGRAREVIVDELGIEPGPGMQSLHARMLAGDPELSPGPPAHPPVVASGRPAGHGRPALVPHLLPPRLPHLVGRDDLHARLAEVAAELRDRPDGCVDATPVVALSGPPGIGKSAVAVDAAHQLRRLFPDGELYIDLRGHGRRPRTAEDALGMLLAGFGMPEIPDRPDERLAHYRRLLIDRRMLIVLDNALDTDVVRWLLPVAGASLVVVTSRRRLVELDTRWHADLEPLDERATHEMLADVAGRDRIRRDPEAAARIVRASEGVPLAVRAAGARLAAHPSSPIRALADRLTHGDDWLGEFAFGSLDLRDALHDSYRGLPGSTRIALRTLAAEAPPTITPRTAGELLDVSPRAADRLLEQLLRDNLLRPQPSPDGEPRYRMLDMIRAYARDES